MSARPTLADPLRIAPLPLLIGAVEPGLGEAAAMLLCASQRIAVRLATLIDARLGPADPALLDDSDRAILAAGPAHRESARLIAGALAHAGRIRLLVSGAEVGRFVEACGHAARDAVFAVSREAGAEPFSSSADLVADVRAAGSAIFAGWRQALPPGFAARLALVQPDIAPLPPGESGSGHAALYRLA
ncbi:MAG TPA: hypothetical protein VF286_02650, partial [Acidiphilium sp.]